MAEQNDHSMLDKDLAADTTAVNTPAVHTPLNLEKADVDNPSRDSTSKDEHDLEKKPEEGEPKPNVEYPVGFRLFAIVIALILSIFLVALDMTIVATAIPRITDEFHSLNQVGWYGSAFFLTVAAFQSMWGKAYKYFLLKPTFLFSIFIFELGSLICAVANDSTTLIVGRAIAGAGGAGIASGVYTIIAVSAPPKQRPAFTGLLGATYGCASVIGPLLGGVFTQNLTWRWCFWINLPIGGASAAIIVFTFRTPAHVQPTTATWREKVLQMDIPGAALIMGAAICYLLALQWGGITKSWSNSSVIGTLVGFGLIVIVFIVLEYHMGERALMQGRLLKQKIIVIMAIYVITICGLFFILLYYLPIYFQSVDGVSPSQSGIRNLPLVLSCSLFTIISGILITVLGHYVPIMIFSTVMATIGGGLIYTLDIGSPAGHWIGYQIIAGIGLGMGFQIPIIVAQASVALEDLPTVTAVVLFYQTIGGALFVSAGETGFENKLIHSLAVNAPSVAPATIIATGASDLHTVFQGAVLDGILRSYVDGLRVAFAIGVALAGLSIVPAAFAPWKKIDASKLMKGE